MVELVVHLPSLFGGMFVGVIFGVIWAC